MIQERPKVVVVGGGTGIFSVLSGLKNQAVELSAVVSMADNGGSTGRLREEFGVLPPGDVRMALVALSESDQILAELFNYRFNGSSLKHSFGNLFLIALGDLKGGFAEGVHEAARILKVKGRVLPATLDDVQLMAELENGQIIEGETNIDCPKHDDCLRLKRVFYNKPCSPNQEASRAIDQADFIVVGPGDIYTSIVPNLLVPGIKEALLKSPAKKIYLCNLMTKVGETNKFKGEDFVEAMEEYLVFDVFDWIVFNNKRPESERIQRYEKERSDPVDYSIEKLKNRHARIVEEDLLRPKGFIRHDLKKVSRVIMNIIDAG